MRNETVYGGDFFSVVKAVLLSLGISFLLALIFAVVLRTTAFGEEIVYPVNQTLKAISIAVGALAFVKGEKGWLKGGLVGVFFTALSYLAFSSLGGDFSLSWLILTELVIAVAVGAVSGILAVNLKK